MLPVTTGSVIILLRFRPNLGIAVIVDLNMDDTGSATHWTVLYIRLVPTFGEIKRNNDGFTTGIANVTALFL